MHDDPINAEIRAARRELAAAFDNDPAQILADVRHREKSDGRTYVTHPPRRIPTLAAESCHSVESVNHAT